MRTTFRNRSVPAGLIAVLLGVLRAARPGVHPGSRHRSECHDPAHGRAHGWRVRRLVRRREGRGGVRGRRPAVSRDALVAYGTRLHVRGCTLGQYVGFYGDTGRAKEVFGQQSPDKYYAKTWPWKPKFVDAPEGLNADRTQVICLDGAPATGCTEWYYWAQYGKALFKMSMSHLAGDLPKISEGDFLRNVRSADARVDGVLGSL